MSRRCDGDEIHEGVESDRATASHHGRELGFEHEVVQVTTIEPRGSSRDRSRNDIARSQLSVGVMLEKEPAAVRVNDKGPRAS
jgi:hypothetical protein